MPQQTSCEMPRQTTVRQSTAGRAAVMEASGGSGLRARDVARTEPWVQQPQLPNPGARHTMSRVLGDERLRITIGGKVFGIALLLVVLMGVAAAISSYLVRDAAFALTRVNQTYVPLSETMAEVGIYQLEQELMALELFADLRDPDVEQAVIERRLTQLKDRGSKVDEALARARRLVAQASDDPRYQGDLAELVRLESLIASIDREHQDFENQSTRIVSVLQLGGGDVSRMLLDDWHRQEEEFNAELAKAITTVSGHAAAAGEDAQAAERGVHQTNVVLTAVAAIAGLLLAAAIVRGLV